MSNAQSLNLKGLYIAARSRTKTPAAALAMARDAIEGGKSLYKDYKYIQFNPPSDRGLRWIENANKGLRFHNYCDLIARSIRHTGWYMADADFAETMRGVVYRLPHGRFVAGYVEGYGGSKGFTPNDDGARLDMSCTYSDELDAALAADSIAEHWAEESREYNEAWRAADDCYNKTGEIKKLRSKRIRLEMFCGVLRAIVKKKRGATIEKAALRCAMHRLESCREEIKELSSEIAELERNWKHHDGFTSY